MKQGRHLVPDAVFVDVVIVDILRGREKQRSPSLILKYFEQDDDFRKKRIIQNNTFLIETMKIMPKEQEIMYKALRDRGKRRLHYREKNERTPAILLGLLAGVETMPEYLNHVKHVENLLIDALHCLWSFLHFGGADNIHQVHIKMFKRHVGNGILNTLYFLLTLDVNGYETVQTFAAGCLAQLAHDDLEIRDTLIDQGIIGNLRTKLKSMSQEELDKDENGEIQYPYPSFLRLRLEMLSILARVVNCIKKDHFQFFIILLDILPSENLQENLIECKLICFLMMEISDEVAEELSLKENEEKQLLLLNKLKFIFEITPLQVFAAIIVMKLVNKTNTRHTLLKGGTLDSLMKILAEAEHTEKAKEWISLCIINAIKSLLWNGDPLAKKLSLKLNIIEKLNRILNKDLSSDLLIVILQCLWVLFNNTIHIQTRSVRLLVHKTLISKLEDRRLSSQCRMYVFSLISIYIK